MRQLARVLALRLPRADERVSQTERLGRAGFLVHTSGTWVIASKSVCGDAGETPASNGLHWAEGGDLFRSEPDDAIRAAEGTPAALRRLAGDFSFLLVTPHDELVAVRSVAGMVPWYHWTDGARAAVGSHLGDLVTAVLPDAALDAGAIAHYASAAALPGTRTFVKRVRVQPPATRVRLAPGSLESRGEVYWREEDFGFETPTRASFDRHAEEMRAILLQTLTRCLAPEGNLLTVSGGVDSSVLAAVAVNALQQRIHTLTFFAPDREIMARDARFVDGLLDSLERGVDRRWARRLNEETRMSLTDAAPRELGLVRHPPLCMLPELMREAKVTTLVGGEFADAVVGCGPNKDMWMTTVGARELLTRPALWPFAARSTKSWIGFSARRRLGRPPITVRDELSAVFAPELRAEYAETRRSWQGRCSLDPLGYFRLRRERATAISAVSWEVTSALGVARAYPFWGREMVELALRTHPVEVMGPGSKQVLRSAMRGLVPAPNLARLDKGHGGVVVPSWLPFCAELPEILAGVVRPDWLPRPPDRLDASDALLLASLVNIVDALRIKSVGKVTA